MGLALPAVVLGGQGVTGLKAFCREGQTFLTWKEDGSKWYRVYAADRPIRAAAEAALVAKIPQGSNRFGFLRNVDTSKGFFQSLAAEEWCRAIQIEDDQAGAKQLPDGTGLFVRTIKKPARTYYAVTGEAEGEAAAAIRPGVNGLTQPVQEQVAPPGAVLQRKLDERYYVYAFFCDYELWNGDGVDDNWDGYVHVFHIRAPDPKRRDTKQPYPVSFRLHAFGAWRDWNIPYCYPATHVDVRLLDYHLTWWYGYSDALPGRLPRSRIPPKGMVVNFSERRVLQVARWLAGGPKNFPFQVDPDQISVFGGSMGGTGTHCLGVRNGDVFAAAFADEGIFNWALPREHNSWVNDVAGKFGPQDRNDMTNEGVGVYDLLNLTRWVAQHPQKELPFMSIGQGMVDFVIPFHDFVNYLKALEAGKHPYAAGWEVMGHMPWAGSGSPMDYRKVRRDEVVPAFANASCNSTLRSGFRIVAKYESVDGGTLTIKPGSLKSPCAAEGGFPPGLAGMALMLGPSSVTRDTFTIASSTPTSLTVKQGSLADYLPPLTGWDIHVLKQNIKKDEGKDRDPTEQEKRAKAEANKKTFLICDGEPRGCWSGHFTWSTRNQDFDPKQAGDDIVDAEKKLAICIRLGRNAHAGEWGGETATADVTPRRCRKFRPLPGEQVRWENWDCSNPSGPKKVAEGQVAADEHGLVTVPKFLIGKAGWGSRLVLTRP
ncbi:MAG: hypothetical protein AMJ81_12670 [Phycisphaerae bacterium SM23_33]|nr:MAG: hypothetical protein AMJ81_12670 [Phycisphaerae bacterium SM23_33]